LLSEYVTNYDRLDLLHGKMLTQWTMKHLALWNAQTTIEQKKKRNEGVSVSYCYI
jgi:hypothetical protein